MSKKRKQTQTLVQSPPTPREYKDQPLDGGWNVFIPGTGISYANVLPKEERQKRLEHCSVPNPKPEDSVPN
jgi:hypothetical protein